MMEHFNQNMIKEPSFGSPRSPSKDLSTNVISSNSESPRNRELQKMKEYGKDNKRQKSLLMNINDTICEPTFCDDTINPSDITVVARTLAATARFAPSVTTYTQTETELISKQDAKEELQLAELKYQGEMLLKSREFGLIQKEYEAALSLRQEKLKEVHDKFSMTLKINRYTKEILEHLMEKKKLMEDELQQEIMSICEKHHVKMASLQARLDAQQSELAESDASAKSLLKKCERMRGIIEEQSLNEVILHTEMFEVGQKMEEIKSVTAATLSQLEQHIVTEYAEREQDIKSYESEINNSMVMLNLAELKIIRLTESLEAKENECNRMGSALDKFQGLIKDKSKDTFGK